MHLQKLVHIVIKFFIPFSFLLNQDNFNVKFCFHPCLLNSIKLVTCIFFLFLDWENSKAEWVSLKGSFAIISHVLFYALTNRFVAERKNRRRVTVLNFETLLQFYDDRRDCNRQQKIMFADNNAREIFTQK